MKWISFSGIFSTFITHPSTLLPAAEDAFEDLVNSNYKFYQKVSNDPEVAEALCARLLERFLDGRKKPV